MKSAVQRRARHSLSYIALSLWALVCLFPLYWVAITSLKGGREIVEGPFYLPFVDFWPHLDAWAYILSDPYDNLLGRYLNSATVALVSALSTLLFGGMAVYGLTRFKPGLPWRSVALCLLAAASVAIAILVPPSRWLLFPVAAIVPLLLLTMRFFRHGPTMGSDGLLTAILATRILPPVIVVLPVYLAAQYFGTLDTRLGLVLVYTAANLPVAVWLLYGVFGEAFTEQEEAAQLDGASHVRVFFEIFVPTIAASLAATGFLIFILCWNEYLFAVYLTGTEAMTLPPWLAGQMSTHEAQASGDQEEWTRLSAATVMMVLPPLALTAMAQRLISRAAIWRP